MNEQTSKMPVSDEKQQTRKTKNGAIVEDRVKSLGSAQAEGSPMEKSKGKTTAGAKSMGEQSNK